MVGMFLNGNILFFLFWGKNSEPFCKKGSFKTVEDFVCSKPSSVFGFLNFNWKTPNSFTNFHTQSVHKGKFWNKNNF